MDKRTANLLAVGDLVLAEPNAEAFFAPSRAALRAADLLIAQIEVPFVPPAADPRNIPALVDIGLDVGTLAGNHVFDSGEAGVRATIDGLKSHGIEVVGAGMNIAEARRPVIVERNGIRFGVLSYNCTGTAESWAKHNKAGGAYVQVITHYELDYAGPGGPPVIYTFADPLSLEAMLRDVRALRPQCDILVVALHKGLLHVPAKMAMYEGPVSHAVIDAGADIILGHHAHILKGIEVYRGKPIYHNLGNFVTVTMAITYDKKTTDPSDWAARRRELFAFEPDPEYPPYYPFHPESKYTLIAKTTVEGNKIARIAYIPCLIDKSARPQILKRSEGGEEVFAYVQKITNAAGLNARYEWDGDEVLVLPKE